LRASIYHGNIGEGIHDLRQHIWIFHLSLISSAAKSYGKLQKRLISFCT
jgi:hypothetical protein